MYAGGEIPVPRNLFCRQNQQNLPLTSEWTAQPLQTPFGACQISPHKYLDLLITATSQSPQFLTALSTTSALTLLEPRTGTHSYPASLCLYLEDASSLNSFFSALLEPGRHAGSQPEILQLHECKKRAYPSQLTPTTMPTLRDSPSSCVPAPHRFNALHQPPLQYAYPEREYVKSEHTHS